MTSDGKAGFLIDRHTQPQSPLCALPPELRLLILEYLLTSNERRTSAKSSICRCKACIVSGTDEEKEYWLQDNTRFANIEDVEAYNVEADHKPFNLNYTTRFYLDIMQTCQLFYFEGIDLLRAEYVINLGINLHTTQYSFDTNLTMGQHWCVWNLFDLEEWVDSSISRFVIKHFDKQHIRIGNKICLDNCEEHEYPGIHPTGFSGKSEYVQALEEVVELFHKQPLIKDKTLTIIYHDSVRTTIIHAKQLKDKQFIGVWEQLRCKEIKFNDIGREHYEIVAERVESNEPIATLLIDAKQLGLRLLKETLNAEAEDFGWDDYRKLQQDIEVAARAFDVDEFKKQENKILRKIDKIKINTDEESVELELDKVFADCEDFVRRVKLFEATAGTDDVVLYPGIRISEILDE